MMSSKNENENENDYLYIIIGKIAVHQAMNSGMPASPEKFRNLLGDLERFTGCSADKLREAYAFLASQSIQKSLFSSETEPIGFNKLLKEKQE